MINRQELDKKVWAILQEMAKDAAPGSITPKEFASVAVAVVIDELIPVFRESANMWDDIDEMGSRAAGESLDLMESLRIKGDPING